MVHIVEKCLLARDMTDSKTAAMGRVEVRKAGHIVVWVGAEQDIDTDVPEQCEVQLVEATHSAEGCDGLVHSGGHVRHASTLVLASGADHGSG